ncbi:MAG: hypothetical protein COA32_11575 [Fluviicola sp.]|nr:MAG: hypothetical protein COA32_11575 [Fluviicola sp.]
MFVIIYKFKVKNGSEAEFVKYWKLSTEIFVKHQGSLGSRLHKESDNTYIAYAQWSNEENFNNSGAQLSKRSIKVIERMRNSCNNIEILHRMHCVKDMLINN